MLYWYMTNKSARFLCAKILKSCTTKVYFSILVQDSFSRFHSSRNFKVYNNYNGRKYLLCVLTKILKYSTDGKECWNCSSRELHQNFCDQCKIIQPLNKELNYFEILGLKESFKVHISELIMNYRKLQSIFHPDKYSVKSEKEQRYAAEYSSLVNEAYNVIFHPVSRGEYMLSIAGQPIEEGELTMEAEFLMNIMEVNERLADADEKETVQEISRKNNSIMEGLLWEAEEAFASNDITTARRIVAKLKYYNNIYEKVKEYEARHGIVY